MRLVTSEKLPASPASLVLTGDGRTELRVLSSLALKYNGRKILFYPKIPIVHKGADILAALLHPISSITGKYREITKFLIIIDREHISSVEDIKAKLARLKFRTRRHRVIRDNVHIVEGLFGGRRITLYIVVCGTRWCLEEEIAKLIELRYKVKFVATSCTELKLGLRRFEKEQNKKWEAVIKEAPKKELERAFTGLTHVLKLLEE
ncbi:MAG: hypothetical protein GXO66_00415 [Euryarchaeota archaeon]|nr:hypothetical protein [Euryarchaeota archaeon]